MNRNMEFILGVLVGASLMIAWGYILHRKRKKVESFTQSKINEIQRRWTLFQEELLDSKDFQKVSLGLKLRAALDREDYKEAARLRDLMNKQ